MNFHLPMLVVSMSLLVGCASQQLNKSQGYVSAANCLVSVKQDGVDVPNQGTGPIDFYELKAAPFRLEVPSPECKPSVGLFRSVNDFRYVAESRLVASIQGFGMASNYENRDVLFIRAEDPRVSGIWADESDATKKEYQELCEEFGTCPLKVRAVRNYWNFVDDQDGHTANYAEFKRLTMEKQLKGVRGSALVVVYTTVKDIHSAFVVMETHPMILNFK